MKAIIVTGTPGTGKTAIARKLARKLNFYCLDVNRLLAKNKLYEGYDKKRKAKIVDAKKLSRFLIDYIHQFRKSNKNFSGIIIDSHLSHYIPRKCADLCIVAKCEIKELGRRLKKRRYSMGKIRENLQAEIFDVCYNEALERNHNIIIANTTKGINISFILRQL